MNLAVVVICMTVLVGLLFWALAALARARAELARRAAGDEALEEARRTALEAQLKVLENRFAALAASQLAERQRELVGLNAQSVGALFGGLRDSLQKYENAVAAAKAETRDSAVKMAENVKELQRFAQEAQRFTAALIGGNKIQGNKGEEILAGILEQSGLQNGVEYEAQVGRQDDGGRPDVCVFDSLNRRSIFIDAKMNIKDFIEAYNLPDDTVDHRRVKKAALQKHVTSIRAQIDGLSRRRYPETVAPPREGYVNLPLVAMFCPFNAVLEAALVEDPSLMQYAFERNVVLVTPLTLWGYLWLIAYGWKRVASEKRFEDIQTLGGKIVEKVDDLLQDIDAVEDALEKAAAACENLRKRAGDKGQMSVKRAAEELLQYGATPRRQVRAVGRAD